MWVIIMFLLTVMLATCEVVRWYRKGYEEGFDDGHNDAVKEMVEKLK